ISGASRLRKTRVEAWSGPLAPGCQTTLQLRPSEGIAQTPTKSYGLVGLELAVGESPAHNGKATKNRERTERSSFIEAFLARGGTEHSEVVVEGCSPRPDPSWLPQPPRRRHEEGLHWLASPAVSVIRGI